jgi:oxalate decarboxylase/phosphoglucose isomerase-like protein (cupin superfamily)
METVSRRSVIGIAAAAIAGGVVAGDTAAGGDPTDAKRPPDAQQPAAAKTDSVYKFSMSTAAPRRYGESSIREHKLHNFPMSASMSAGLIDLAAGDVREPHWHPNSDEWLFVMAGRVRMTIVDGKGVASQFECGPEDVAFTPQGFGHYVENVGDGMAKLMLVHNHADFTTVNLSEWVAAGSTAVFASTLKMPTAAFDDVPTKRAFVVHKKGDG